DAVPGRRGSRDATPCADLGGRARGGLEAGGGGRRSAFWDGPGSIGASHQRTPARGERQTETTRCCGLAGRRTARCWDSVRAELVRLPSTLGGAKSTVGGCFSTTRRGLCTREGGLVHVIIPYICSNLPCASYLAGCAPTGQVARSH